MSAVATPATSIDNLALPVPAAATPAPSRNTLALLVPASAVSTTPITPARSTAAMHTADEEFENALSCRRDMIKKRSGELWDATERKGKRMDREEREREKQQVIDEAGFKVLRGLILLFKLALTKMANAGIIDALLQKQWKKCFRKSWSLDEGCDYIHQVLVASYREVNGLSDDSELSLKYYDSDASVEGKINPFLRNGAVEAKARVRAMADDAIAAANAEEEEELDSGEAFDPDFDE
ncbi:hypothetical protein LTR91_017996 [Friedmanniomyces endolithicus]|uniref:Uncharacterized protein n=1 Tax=Friedmanniomyces endolithicus TaxID=329885 RepID=A0AAN6HDT2_9PEZI|nr:hypothetical protein LTR91_017996 [Friedmanniomyces endolithicus]